MVTPIGADSFSIEGLSKNDLIVLERVITAAPLPDKRVLYELKNEIKEKLTNA